MKYWHTIAVVSVVMLSACSGSTVKETLGLGRSAPDEYRVVSRPPLSVPPQFNLRPPATSDTSPNQLAASAQAKSLVLDGKVPDAANGSTGVDTAVVPVTASDAKKHAAKEKPVSGAESQFLKDAGADKADPRVRDTLVEEHYAVQEKREETHWWNPMTWGEAIGESNKKDAVVDSKKEAERIQKNQDEGKPVTTGDTPNVKGKDSGILGSILGY